MPRPELRSDTSSNGISAVVPQTSFLGETGGGVPKCLEILLKKQLPTAGVRLQSDYHH